jgi:hypothetical protein
MKHDIHPFTQQWLSCIDPGSCYRQPSSCVLKGSPLHPVARDMLLAPIVNIRPAHPLLCLQRLQERSGGEPQAAG